MSTTELSKKTAAATIECTKTTSHEKIEKLTTFYRRTLPTDPNSYVIGCKIGHGSFGLSTLRLAQLKNGTNGNLYVVKKLIVDNLTDKEIEIIQKEIHIASRLNHPYILSYYSSFIVDHNVIWTIFPLFNFGSCRDVMSAEFNHGLPFLLVSTILRSVVLALEYLHKAGFIHRAVNASHILLSSDNRACLSGLRHCLAIPKDNHAVYDFQDDTVQVLPWVAPEILMQNALGYNEKSDIYSLGITAVELVTGAIPYSKLRPTEILLQKLRGVIPKLPEGIDVEDFLSASQSSLDGLDPTNDMTFSPMQTATQSGKKIRNMQQLVESCLQADVNLRPSAGQLRNCSFFRGIKKKIRDKECTSFKDTLQPLTPILEISFDDKDIVPEVEVHYEDQFDKTWTF